MQRITSQQLTKLGDCYLAFAQAVGNYRIENRASITRAQNQKMSDFHWTLLNYADDLYTTSARLVINDVQSSLDTIGNVTNEISQTYQNLRRIQKAINVAAAGVTLGAAIFSRNPQAITYGISGLVESWNAEEEE